MRAMGFRCPMHDNLLTWHPDTFGGCWKCSSCEAVVAAYKLSHPKGT